MKKWVVRQPKKEFSDTLMKEIGVSRLCADVLSSRGFENENDAAKKFFYQELCDPFELKDMERAAEIINEALENGDRICIYGDYDCDGITSTVMLYSYLECMGADVVYRLPERSEGYGLNKEVVREIAGYGTQLIITVDNGISAYEEAELVYELGMKLIITDHHQPGEELPKAEAIVNPHRKDSSASFKNLCGAGVVLKLIAALEDGDYETALNEYGDLAAIGTVADIVELGGENRYIVTYGLNLLENSQRYGIQALIEKCKIKFPVSSTSLAFTIAPRINASGRFGSPKTAARLLLTDDKNEADMLCEELEKLNDKRKQTENEITASIGEYINENPDITCERVMVLSGEGWHHGVIGIVASRMTEKFDKPCFIITIEGDMARGSARAFGSFSVFKALEFCRGVLTRYGGHSGAGGFSLKTSDIPEFKKLMREYSKIYFDTMPVPEITADKIITADEIDVNEILGLNVLEPFGQGNPQPIFYLPQSKVIKIIPLSDGLHTKLQVQSGKFFLYVLFFRHTPEEMALKPGDMIDLMINLGTQIFNGYEIYNIIGKDFRISGMSQSKFFSAQNAYEKFKRDEELPPAYYERICPDRKELITVYTKIKSMKFSPETLYMSLMSDNMNYCKLCICVDIFAELGLVKFDRFTREISVIADAPKVNLDDSEIFRKIRTKANKL